VPSAKRRPDDLLARVRRELSRATPVDVYARQRASGGRLGWPRWGRPAGIAAGLTLAAVLAAVAFGRRPPPGPAVLLPTSIVVPSCAAPAAADDSDPDQLGGHPQTPGGTGTRAEQPEPERFVVEVVNTGKTVEVVCAGRAGEPDDDSYRALRHELRSSGGAESPLDPRLVELLHQVAKRTHGSVQVLSAFRPPKTTHDHNYHTRGMAADIRVAGMSTARLRDLARSLGAPGVGYYPTSQFVHVDMRDGHYEWTDTSGPGQNGDDTHSQSASSPGGGVSATPGPGEVAAGAGDAGTESAGSVGSMARAAPPPVDPVLTAAQQAQQAPTDPQGAIGPATARVPPAAGRLE
jgi:uncharacterized protein YcbK (DUF882 family)